MTDFQQKQVEHCATRVKEAHIIRVKAQSVLDDAKSSFDYARKRLCEAGRDCRVASESERQARGRFLLACSDLVPPDPTAIAADGSDEDVHRFA